MKTPEEIKKGLSLHRSNLDCYKICPYDGWSEEGGSCIQRLMRDTVEYIEHIESRLAQAERERDSMSYDMHQLQGALCSYCENLYRVEGVGTVSCRVFGNDYGGEDGVPLICGRFKWRGVCDENTKED